MDADAEKRQQKRTSNLAFDIEETNRRITYELSDVRREFEIVRREFESGDKDQSQSVALIRPILDAFKEKLEDLEYNQREYWKGFNDFKDEQRKRAVGSVTSIVLSIAGGVAVAVIVSLLLGKGRP